MSSLKSYEKIILEEVFEMGNGWVLNFNDKRFASFFREHNINIEAQIYLYIGTSKANRLRALWELENDITVGKILKDLLESAKIQGELKKEEEAQNIINRLPGLEQEPKLSEEDQFLKKEFDKINLSFIKDLSLAQVLNDRLNEIEITIKNNAPLS